MADATLPIGLRHSMTLAVDESLTVPSIACAFDFRDMPPVFATAFMVAFIEATCIEALKPHLAAHQRTVGTHVDVSHIAATPVGMRVTADVELIAVEGRRLRFKVECRDDSEVIGAGFHDRAIIDAARFLARVEAKAQTAKTMMG
jgi:fluoroacetyl-CoA thioesterase